MVGSRRWPRVAGLVVLDAVFLGVFGQHDGVVDLVDEQSLVFQGAEAGFS